MINPRFFEPSFNVGPFIIDLIKVAFATFLGALSAFQIQRKYNEHQEIKQNFRAGKRAQFALINQWQSIMAATKQHLAPKKEDPFRLITLLPFDLFCQPQQIDIQSLLFILDNNDPNLLSELTAANQTFQTFLGILDARNKAHVNFQQRASQIGKENAFDEATQAILKDHTDSLYEIAEESMKLNMDLFERLRTFLDKYYKKGKSLRFIPKIEEGQKIEERSNQSSV